MADRAAQRIHTAPSARIELLDDLPGVYRFHRWQHVHVIVWSGQADGETAKRLGRVTPKPAAGTRHSDVHVVLTSAGLPSAAARAGFVQLMREMEKDIACLGVVIEGEGFWASAMRSAIIGLGMLAPKGLRLRVLGSVDEVIGWLPAEHQRCTGVATDAAGLLEALREARHGTSPGAAAGPGRR